MTLLVLRIAIVLSWHQPAGDGVQYYHVAQQLRAGHRFAFNPPPAPLVYSRLPGYPLFLALATAGRPVSFGQHLRIATVWNVVFDFATAAFMLGVAARLGLRRRRVLALGLLLLPTLWLMSCYALTESLSTLLTAGLLYFAIATMHDPARRSVGATIAAGAAAGFALLVRFDAICLVPAVAYACASAPAMSRGRRAVLAGVFLAATAATFAPWPIRNMIRFGAPHFAATTWRTATGKPLGDGPVYWARTWADSATGDSYFELYFVYSTPVQIERPGVVNPKSYDDEQERQRVVAAFKDFNAHGLTDAVNAKFLTLARDRFARHPLRTLVVLPAKRIFHLFAPEPEYEMPMRIGWLGLPMLRPVFGALDVALFAAALLGCIGCWRSRYRRYLPLLLLPVALRLLIYGFAIPQATTERYLVEVFPIFALLALIAWNTLRPAARNDGP